MTKKLELKEPTIGTKKQIEWAKKIRAEAIENGTLEKQSEIISKYAEEVEADFFTKDKIDAWLEFVCEMTDNASIYIDVVRRNMWIDENILPCMAVCLELGYVPQPLKDENVYIALDFSGVSDRSVMVTVANSSDKVKDLYIEAAKKVLPENYKEMGFVDAVMSRIGTK